MRAGLSGVKIAVLGGDARDLILIPELVKLGAEVRVVGFPPLTELQGAYLLATIREAIEGANVIILPMPGTDPEGVIRATFASEKLVLTEEILRKIPSSVPIIIGVAQPFIQKLAQRYQLRLLEIAERDDVAILNSIPSAEGAIQIAMQELPITIHGSNSFVFGFGRLAQTLTRMLKALGAWTSVVARKPKDLARCYELGYQAIPFERYSVYIHQAEIIFNTVPAMVLNASVLEKLSKETLIIDLALAPGGTDFKAAAALGIKAKLTQGLPGKVAPVTAGKIRAQVIPSLILQELGART